MQRIVVGEGQNARTIAVDCRSGASPAIVWLGGFRSDMRSGKAEALAAWAADAGRAMVRFDYSGHGASGGAFEEGTITRWRAEAEAVIAHFCPEPPILVGSSMGGWIALLAARATTALHGRGRLAGIVLIAPAVDFTETLMWQAFPPEIRGTIEREGVWYRPSAYSDDPYPITRGLIEDGRNHLLYGEPFEVGCPVHVLQGMRDPDVPWRHALQLVEHLPLDTVTTTVIADGDHRLSREKDIAVLVASVAAIA